MKLPMKRKITGSANGANAACAVATPRMMQSVGPTSAVTASGSASVIHNTIMSTSTAATRCAGGGNAVGMNRIAIATSGPAMRPNVCRCRLNRSSAGE